MLNEYINQKLKDIADKLPNLVHSEPASFSCGFHSGYKQAMLDLDGFLQSGGHIPNKIPCKNLVDSIFNDPYMQNMDKQDMLCTMYHRLIDSASYSENQLGHYVGELLEQLPD